MTTMTEARLLAIIAAHGAASNHWPDEERDAALALLKTSAAAQQALEDAVRLDALLAENHAPPVSLALQSRIAAIPEQPRPSAINLIRSFWPFGAIWRPASGLAAAAVIGVLVGIGTPGDDLSAAPIESEAYAAVITAAGGEIEEITQ